MDIITQAIMTATGRRSEEGVDKVYQTFKETLQEKFAPDSNLVAVIDKLEHGAPPDKYLDILEEDVISEGANKDDTLIKQARTLVSMLQRPDIQVTPSGTVLPGKHYEIYEEEDDW